tara:strand:- start:348867 stop:349967 length:1101 start_codon:yes stop_codon:yes gene_type:complete
MKRIILSLDGTWQTADQDNPSNIHLMHECFAATDKDGNEQRLKHFDGVGTKGGKLKQIWAGLTGSDVSSRIKEAYKYLVENYESGDEVVLSGFSRGAFTARTLNGMIYKCGILDGTKAENIDIDEAVDEAYSFYKNNIKPQNKGAIQYRIDHSHEQRPQVILACFDTVGSLGVPAQLRTLGGIFNKRHAFHDTRVNPHTKHAFHIAAIDEQRKNFPVTPMTSCKDATTSVKQIWFSGNHAAIGGGSSKNKNKPLSDNAGIAMIKLLENDAGLAFDHDKVNERFTPDPLVNPQSDFKQKGLIWKISGLHTKRPISLKEAFDFSVMDRWNAITNYRPSELKKFLFKDADNAETEEVFGACAMPKPKAN